MPEAVLILIGSITLLLITNLIAYVAGLMDGMKNIEKEQKSSINCFDEVTVDGETYFVGKRFYHFSDHDWEPHARNRKGVTNAKGTEPNFPVRGFIVSDNPKRNNSQGQ